MSGGAQGVYHYWRDGLRQALREPWTLESAGAEAILRGQRCDGAEVLLEVEAHYRAGRCVALDLRWQPQGPAPSRIRYRLEGEVLRWSRDDGAPQELAVTADSLLFPLLRAAMGPLLRRLCEAPASVWVPRLHDASAADFLEPLGSRRRATPLADGACRYFGGEYGEAGCECWLDARGLLQRYRWHEWDVRLEDYAGTASFGT